MAQLKTSKVIGDFYVTGDTNIGGNVNVDGDVFVSGGGVQDFLNKYKIEILMGIMQVHIQQILDIVLQML